MNLNTTTPCTIGTTGFEPATSEPHAGDTVRPYRLSLAVDVTDAQGVKKRVRITVPAQRTSTITVPVVLARSPKSVVFDADVSILGTERSM